MKRNEVPDNAVVLLPASEVMLMGFWRAGKKRLHELTLQVLAEEGVDAWSRSGDILVSPEDLSRAIALKDCAEYHWRLETGCAEGMQYQI